MDGQLEGRGGEGLRHGVAGVASVGGGRHRRVFLQGGQGRGVGGVVCDGDVPGSVQAARCGDALHVVGHGVDGSDGTALGNDGGKTKQNRWRSVRNALEHDNPR